MVLWRVYVTLMMFLWMCEGKSWSGVFQPVCGENGITYPSSCLTKFFHVKVDCDGVCPCNRCVCPAIYQPVCGEDGKTYSNSCEAGCVNMEVECEGNCPCWLRLREGFIKKKKQDEVFCAPTV